MEILIGIIVIVVVVVWFKSKSSDGGKPGMQFAPAKTRSESTIEFRDLLDKGKSLIALGDELPFGINYMKSEQPIIAVDNVSFIRNRSEYIAGNAGVSVRVMKGVSFRTGGTKGRRIETPVTCSTRERWSLRRSVFISSATEIPRNTHIRSS